MEPTYDFANEVCKLGFFFFKKKKLGFFFSRKVIGLGIYTLHVFGQFYSILHFSNLNLSILV